jgi:hypothetical protein
MGALALGIYLHPKPLPITPFPNVTDIDLTNGTFAMNGTLTNDDHHFSMGKVPYMLLITAGIMGFADTWLNTLMLADVMRSHGDHVMGSLVCMFFAGVGKGQKKRKV